jgi:hypothetical protein
MIEFLDKIIGNDTWRYNCFWRHYNVNMFLLMPKCLFGRMGGNRLFNRIKVRIYCVWMNYYVIPFKEKPFIEKFMK